MSEDETDRRRMLGAFARSYARLFPVFAFMLIVFEALFGWGLGAFGLLLPALVASNRAAEARVRGAGRRLESLRAWRLAGEMGLLTTTIAFLITIAVSLPLVALTGQWPALSRAVAGMPPGILLASFAFLAGLSTLVIRFVLPMQIRALQAR